MCRWCGCCGDGCGSDAKNPVPVEGMAEAVLLLLLAERPQYGYELAQRIAEEELVAGRVRAARVYETLARLSDAGFAAATKEHSPQGPDRWRYTLTPAGELRLAHWRSGLGRSYNRVGDFLRRYDHRFGPDHGHGAPQGRHAETPVVRGRPGR